MSSDQCIMQAGHECSWRFLMRCTSTCYCSMPSVLTDCVRVQEFDSIESAQHIMESDLRYQFDLDGAPLRLDYSHGAQPAAAASASATSDWMCPGCSAVNFSRWVCASVTPSSLVSPCFDCSVCFVVLHAVCRYGQDATRHFTSFICCQTGVS